MKLDVAYRTPINALITSLDFIRRRVTVTIGGPWSPWAKGYTHSQECWFASRFISYGLREGELPAVLLIWSPLSPSRSLPFLHPTHHSANYGPDAHNRSHRWMLPPGTWAKAKESTRLSSSGRDFHETATRGSQYHSRRHRLRGI